MEYEQKQFFTENEMDDVKGFTILQAKNEQYHIAEKWLSATEDGEDKWLDYWIPEGDLLARVVDGDCEPSTTVSDQQFEKICKRVGQRYDTGEIN